MRGFFSQFATICVGHALSSLAVLALAPSFQRLAAAMALAPDPV
jgi:hypothetical protein